jgi:hypothetical protein
MRIKDMLLIVAVAIFIAPLLLGEFVFFELHSLCFWVCRMCVIARKSICHAAVRLVDAW